MRALLLVWLSMALLACGAAASRQNPSPEARKLVAQTLHNMVFVDGGTFMMGDYIHVPIREGRQRCPGSSGSKTILVRALPALRHLHIYDTKLLDNSTLYCTFHETSHNSQINQSHNTTNHTNLNRRKLP